MNKRHAVYEYHTENSQLDVYHGTHHDSCGFTSAYTRSGFAVAALEARS